MPTRVRELTTGDEWDEAVPVLRELWESKDPEEVRSWRKDDEYRLFGLYEAVINGEGAGSHEGSESEADLVAVAGLSIQRVMHHVRHAWLHDLVVTEGRRGEGFGGEFVDWIEDWARERDCEYVALACIEDNDEAREFYEREGLEVWGHVMETEL